MTTTWIGSALATLATLGIATAVAGDPPPPNSERHAVLEQLEQARRRLGELRIRYSFPLPKHAARGAFVSQGFCFDDDRGVVFDSSHGEDGITYDRWTERQTTIVVADGWLAVWPNKRTYAWSHEQRPVVPREVRQSPVMRTIGLWPLRGRYDGGVFEDTSFDLEQVVADPRYRLSSGTDGRVIVERDGLDRCVLDSRHGYALRERVWRDAEGRELMRVTVPALHAAGEGLWLPAELHVDTTSTEGGVGNTDRLTGRLEEVEPDGRAGFEFELPAGAMLLDHETSALTQVVPGGLGYIESRANAVRRGLEAARSKATGSRWQSNPWLWGLFVFAVGLIAGRQTYREKLS